MFLKKTDSGHKKPRVKEKTNKKDEVIRDRQEKKVAVTFAEQRATHLRKAQNVTEEKKKKNVFSDIGFDPDYFTGALSRITAALLAITLVIYFAYQLVDMFTSSVTTSEVYTVCETVESSGKVYIIRDVQTISLPSGTYPDYSVSDGSRVGKGETVITLYSEDKSQLREKIEELDKEISLLIRSIGTGVADAGLEESFSQVSSEYSLLMQKLAAGNYSAAQKMTDVFREKLARRGNNTGEADKLFDRMTVLENEKKDLQAQFGKSTGVITAAFQGYFYSGTDGYEESLSTEILKDFSEETLEKLHSTEKNTASAGAAARLCPSAEWFAAVECNDRNMRDAELEKEYELSFPDTGCTGFSMTLAGKVYTDDGMLLLFSSSGQCDALLGERIQNVTVKAAEYTGYRIPESALHVNNGYTGVYVLNGRYVYFRRTEIIREGTGYCIAKVYEEAETGVPKQYKIPAFSEIGGVCSYAGLYGFAAEKKIVPKRRDWGMKSAGYILTQIYTDPGIAVKYGQKYRYYYCLSGTETMIISGSDLYDGKVLN